MGSKQRQGHIWSAGTQKNVAENRDRWLRWCAAQKTTAAAINIDNQTINANDVVDLFAGSFELILEDIGEDELNARVMNVSGADGLLLVRWLKNDSGKDLGTRFGAHFELPDCFPDWIDKHLPDSTTLPLLLETIGSSDDSDYAESAAFVNDPRNLCLLLDTDPSRLLYILHREADQPPWSDTERSLLLNMMRVCRQSVRVHKQMDRLKKSLEVSNAVFNSSPRGVIAVFPNGKVRIANRMATQILREEDVINIADNHIKISDRELQRELYEAINSISDMSESQASSFIWHRALPRKNKQQPLQLSMRVVTHAEWHIESLPYDKMAVLFINDPLRLSEPSELQLKEYYGLTGAQASVALALWGGTGITEAADKLSISVNTARTHLRAIYDKVGVKSHAELMAIITAISTEQGDSASPLDFILPIGEPY